MVADRVGYQFARAMLKGEELQANAKNALSSIGKECLNYLRQRLELVGIEQARKRGRGQVAINTRHQCHACADFVGSGGTPRSGVVAKSGGIDALLIDLLGEMMNIERGTKGSELRRMVDHRRFKRRAQDPTF